MEEALARFGQFGTTPESFKSLTGHGQVDLATPAGFPGIVVPAGTTVHIPLTLGGYQNDVYLGQVIEAGDMEQLARIPMLVFEAGSIIPFEVYMRYIEPGQLGSGIEFHPLVGSGEFTLSEALSTPNQGDLVLATCLTATAGGPGQESVYGPFQQLKMGGEFSEIVVQNAPGAGVWYTFRTARIRERQQRQGYEPKTYTAENATDIYMDLIEMFRMMNMVEPPVLVDQAEALGVYIPPTSPEGRLEGGFAGQVAIGSGALLDYAEKLGFVVDGQPIEFTFDGSVSLGNNEFKFVPPSDVDQVYVVSEQWETLGVPKSDLFLDSQELEVGGIDLTQLELVGVQRGADASSVLEFIFKGEPASAGQGIDVEAAMTEAERIFLQALAIPNWEQYVSMDVMTDGTGYARTGWNFKQTDIARYAFEADSALKNDGSLPVIDGWSQVPDYGVAWRNHVMQRPGWPLLEQAGFLLTPGSRLRQHLRPLTIDGATGEGRLLMQSPALGVAHFVDNLGINLSGFNAPVVSEVRAAIDAFYPIMRARQRQRLDELEPLIQANAPGMGAYQDLRRSLPAVAAAHWYKTVVQPEDRYSAIVNRYNLTGFASEIPFDQAYWDAQSNRLIGVAQVTGMAGNQHNVNLKGGAVLTDEELKLSTLRSGFNSDEQELLAKLDADADGVVVHDGSYFIRRQLALPNVAPMANIRVATVRLDDPETLGEQAATDVEIVVSNTGNAALNGFWVQLVGRTIDFQTGELLTERVVEKQRINLAAHSETTLVFPWTPEVGGEHELVAHANYAVGNWSAKREMTRSDNTFQREVYVKSTRPRVIWVGDTELSATQAVAEFSAIDSDGGSLDYVIHSNRQGVLASGTTSDEYQSVPLPNLQPGAHPIKITVTNSAGKTSELSRSVFAYETFGEPVVRVETPIDGASLVLGRATQLRAIAEDSVAGDLCASRNRVSWSSSIDGEILSACAGLVNLSEGTHMLTLTATNAGGIESVAELTVEVEPGEPEVSIVSPLEASILERQASLQGAAEDPQDGLLSGSALRWSSSVDGFLGTGETASRYLSPGIHELTLTATDSDGTKSEASVLVTIVPSLDLVGTASIIQPPNGSVFPEGWPITLQGRIYDQQGLEVPSERHSWTSSVAGNLGTGVPAPTLQLGGHQIALVDAENADLQSSASITVNALPTNVRILSPASSVKVDAGHAVELSAAVLDLFGTPVSTSGVTWSSSIDGLLGTGGSINPVLSPGTHVVSALTQTGSGVVASSERRILVIDGNAQSQTAFTSGSEYTSPEGTSTAYFSMPGGAQVNTAALSVLGSVGTVSSNEKVGVHVNYPINGSSPGTCVSQVDGQGRSTSCAADDSAVDLTVYGGQDSYIRICSGRHAKIATSNSFVYLDYGATYEFVDGAQGNLVVQRVGPESIEWVTSGGSPYVPASGSAGIGLTFSYYFEGVDFVQSLGYACDAASSQYMGGGVSVWNANDWHGEMTCHDTLDKCTIAPAEALPRNLLVDILADQTPEYSQSSSFPFSSVLTFTDILRAHLADQVGLVEVPIGVHREGGALSLAELNVQYQTAGAAGANAPPFIGNFRTLPEMVRVGEPFTVYADVEDQDGVQDITATWAGTDVPYATGNAVAVEWQDTLSATQPGPQILVVQATDSQEQAAEESFEILVNAVGAELVPLPDSLVPSIGITGSPITGRFGVKNWGDQDSGAFTVSLRSGNTVLATEQIDELQAGDTTPVDLTWTPATAGNVGLEFIVDSENVVAEPDEQNNTLTEQLSVTSGNPPEVTSILASSVVSEGEPFEVVAIIQDDTGVDSVTLECFGDATPMLLEADGRYHGSCTATATSNELLKVSATDVDGLSGFGAAAVSVLSSSSVDLQALDVTVSQLGTQRLVEGRVLQRGGAAGQLTASLVVDGVLQGEQSVSINPAEEKLVSWQLSGHIVGNVWELIVDRDDLVAELEEENNIARSEPELTEPAVLESVEVTPPLAPGEEVEARARVRGLVDTMTVHVGGVDYPMEFQLDDGEGSWYSVTFPAGAAGAEPATIRASLDGVALGAADISWVVPSSGVDLEIGPASIAYVLESNNELAITISVNNHGDQDVIDAMVRTELSDNIVDQRNIDLPAGQSASFPLNLSLPEGVLEAELIVRVDPDQQLPERDESNNQGRRIVSLFDTVAPAIPQPLVSPEGWASTPPVQMIWPPVTDISGIDHYEYRLPGEDWQTEEGTLASLVHEDGVALVELRAVDGAGNVSPPARILSMIDTQEPEQVALRQDLLFGDWTPEADVELLWDHAFDLGSGSFSYELSRNEGAAEQLGAEPSAMVTELGTGIHSLRVRAVDAVGRAGAWSDTVQVKIDTDPPLVVALDSSTHPEPVEWYASLPEFSWSVSDAGSGVQRLHWEFDQLVTNEVNVTSWSLPADTTQLSIEQLPNMFGTTPVTDGIWQLRMMAVDEVGNTSAVATRQIRIDRQAPETVVALPDDLEPGAVVTLSGDDAHAGVQEIRYRINDGNWQSGNEVALPDYGLHTLEYYSIDAAGNAEVPHSLEIDARDPMLLPSCAADPAQLLTVSSAQTPQAVFGDEAFHLLTQEQLGAEYSLTLSHVNAFGESTYPGTTVYTSDSHAAGNIANTDAGFAVFVTTDDGIQVLRLNADGTTLSGPSLLPGSSTLPSVASNFTIQSPLSDTWLQQILQAPPSQLTTVFNAMLLDNTVLQHIAGAAGESDARFMVAATAGVLSACATQRISWMGNPMGSQQVVNEMLPCFRPALTRSTPGDLLVWDAHPASSAPVNPAAIWARRLTADDTLGALFQVASADAGGWAPQAYAIGDTAWVIWEKPDDGSIHGRSVAADNTLGDIEQLTAARSGLLNKSILATANDTPVLLWYDATEDEGIYGCSIAQP